MDHFYETRKISPQTQKMPHFVVAIGTKLVRVTLQRDKHTGYTTIRLWLLIFSTIYKINIGSTVTCWATACCVMWLNPTRSMHLYRKCMSPCIYCLDYSLTWLNLLHACQKRPGAPERAEILDQSPTMVVLRVQPPLDDGGMPLLGYRVENDGFMEEFDLGKLYFEGTIQDFEICKEYDFGLVW